MDELSSKIEKILEVLREDLGTIRTGRAAPSLVENISINAYGGTARLRVVELATIGATDSSTLLITPFDQATIQEIEKGIRDENVGLNPVVDGQVIRISIPPLSTERREELIKSMKHKLENGRIMVRQARQEAMNDLKKEKESGMSEDEVSRLEKEIQKTVDETMAKIDEMGASKEADLLRI